MSSGSLQPTWFGHVTTARDALILFEACLNGTLHHVPRRPHDRERGQLIKSGCVFIYEENASGIKRWTDGVPWSPSRILGNFLVYRELMKPFPPGEKKKANKRTKRTKPGEPYPRSNSGDAPTSPTTPVRDNSSESRENERALIGSLVDSYGFKEGGLVKKTMSVTVHGVQHHLVSYYKIEDALDGTLTPPSKDPRLATTEPRSDLIARQNFRAPLDDMDDGMQEQMGGPTNTAYGYGQNSYRPSLVMSPPTHHGQLGMGLYSGMTYSAAPHLQPGLPSYAPTSTQSYYPPTSNVTQSVIPKHEDYSGYSSGYRPHSSSSATLPERSNSRPGSHHSSTYPYHQNSIPGLIPRTNGMLDPSSPASDHRPLSSPLWDRGSTKAVYGPGGPTSNATSAYSNSGSHWGMAATSHALPRPDVGWSGAEAAPPQWTAARHHAYQAATQNHH